MRDKMQEWLTSKGYSTCSRHINAMNNSPPWHPPSHVTVHSYMHEHELDEDIKVEDQLHSTIHQNHNYITVFEQLNHQ